jgi:hypothetical protein
LGRLCKPRCRVGIRAARRRARRASGSDRVNAGDRGGEESQGQQRPDDDPGRPSSPAPPRCCSGECRGEPCERMMTRAPALASNGRREHRLPRITPYEAEERDAAGGAGSTVLRRGSNCYHPFGSHWSEVSVGTADGTSLAGVRTACVPSPRGETDGGASTRMDHCASRVSTENPREDCVWPSSRLVIRSRRAILRPAARPRHVPRTAGARTRV